MLNRKAEVFAPTDGVLSLVTDNGGVSTRGSDFSNAALYATVFTLAFRRMRISARDVELAESIGSEVIAKVEVRNAVGLTPDDAVVMRGGVYEVTRVEDRGRTCWLWLSEVAIDGVCGLIPATYDYDAVGIAVPTKSDPVSVYVRKVATSLKRASTQGVDGLVPSLTLRIRASDYSGEQQLERLGKTYTVIKAESAGRWLDLTCRERGSDRG